MLVPRVGLSYPFHWICAVQKKNNDLQRCHPGGHPWPPFPTGRGQGLLQGKRKFIASKEASAGFEDLLMHLRAPQVFALTFVPLIYFITHTNNRKTSTTRRGSRGGLFPPAGRTRRIWVIGSGLPALGMPTRPTMVFRRPRTPSSTACRPS